MPKVPLYNAQGELVGDFDLDDAVFGAEVNEALLHQAVTMQLAGMRQGTVATKSRGMVSGGGRKPWRQKGTGRARHGSTRSPIWTKGGVVFGPQPRDYKFNLPKKARRVAIKSALSAKVRDGEVLIVEGLHFEAPKTKEMAALLGKMNVDRSAIVVMAEEDANVVLSARNIPGISSMIPTDLNVYDVLRHKNLILTADAAKVVGEVFA
ncbi:MAG: 50S ribosomal protein L4 [Bacillota bacterium]|jgi:large subunit ribosomal protein L4